MFFPGQKMDVMHVHVVYLHLQFVYNSMHIIGLLKSM